MLSVSENVRSFLRGCFCSTRHWLSLVYISARLNVTTFSCSGEPELKASPCGTGYPTQRMNGNLYICAAPNLINFRSMLRTITSLRCERFSSLPPLQEDHRHLVGRDDWVQEMLSL